MRILYIYQYFKFPYSSGGTRSYDLATALTEKGYEVEILTTSSFFQNEELKKGWNIIRREGLKIHVLNLNYSQDLSKIQRIFVFIKFLFSASLKILNLRGDVVLASSTPLTIGIPALIKKWIQGTPYIFEVRDVWPEAVIAIGAIKNNIIKRFLYTLEGVIYKNACAIVPLSTDMKKSITSRYPEVEKKPVEVIENLSQITRFQTGYNSYTRVIKEKIGFEPRFSVLYAGTFGKVNGIDYVVELASELKLIDDSIVFILVGNGSEKEGVIERARAEGVLNENVFVLDSVSKNELPQLYFEASMGSSFVIDKKELWANSANKFFDTLAAGRPVLINHEGWQKEIIISENVGYVLPQKLNREAIIKFAAYTRDQEKLEMQQLNSLATAKERYSLEKAIETYHKLLQNLK